MELALDIENLVLEFGNGSDTVRALDGVNLPVPRGTIMGIVGESGSGKSTIGFAVGRLMPEGVRPEGKLDVLGHAVWDMDIDNLREMRGKDLRYVLQDPIATLDPTKPIGWQVKNAMQPPLSDQQVIDALLDVGLSDAKRVAAAWPHELSGGMAQRVVIAMALVGEPKIIIADEATSALDASVRTRVLELLKNKSRERNITLLLISHDLAAVRMFADQIAVVYAGRIVELGDAKAVFADPVHPYTQALMAATAGHEKPGETLHTIPGIPPQLTGEAANCAFEPRCTFAEKGLCDQKRPQTEKLDDGRSVLCLRWQEITHGTD